MTDITRVKKLRDSRPLNVVDVIVIVVLSALAVVLALTDFGARQTGAQISVSIGGTSTAYPLTENREIVLDTLTIVIEDGEAYVRDSSCPDRVCEYMGRISKVNQSIVCLPEGVIIEVIGESDLQVETGQNP